MEYAVTATEAAQLEWSMAAFGVARCALSVHRAPSAHVRLTRATAQSAVGCGKSRAGPTVGESAFGSAVCRTPTDTFLYFLLLPASEGNAPLFIWDVSPWCENGRASKRFDGPADKWFIYQFIIDLRSSLLSYTFKYYIMYDACAYLCTNCFVIGKLIIFQA